MSQDFYTNVQSYGGKILFRGIQNGKPVRQKLNYHPTLYLRSKTETEFATLNGEYLAPIKPGNIYECREFVKTYSNVDNFEIFGQQRYEYKFIFENYGEDFHWDFSLLNVANIDLEVGSANGFPEPDKADEEITAITLKMRGIYHVFGCGDFTNTTGKKNLIYYKCNNEIELIKKFLTVWEYQYPDIITGWNIRLFDMPYLVNRIRKVLGDSDANRLSPWKIISDKAIDYGNGRKFNSFNFIGISALDYIDLYQRYAPEGKSQESYKLDSIAAVELDLRKLSYEEVGNLHTLYRTNYQKFIEYNIRDVELIDLLEDKLKLLELVATLAYDSGTNFEDAFSQVRMWDVLTDNYLHRRNIIIPPSIHHNKYGMYEGAYVKDPLIGMHKETASFDLDGLYPHLMMMYNISPETLVYVENYTPEMHNILSENINVDMLLHKKVDITARLKSSNITITPNKQFFTLEKQGFLPKMMEEMYAARKNYKEQMIAAQKELELATTDDEKVVIKKKIARFKNLQLAKKVCLNSAYGALGSAYFRFFDIRLAAGITFAGQLSIKWIAERFNAFMNKVCNTENVDYVIAIDTDSVYLSLATYVKAQFKAANPKATTRDTIHFMDKFCDEEIQPLINAAYEELKEYVNAYAQKMHMKRETLCDKAIWTAKKRYILNVWNSEGVEYTKPKIKVMGLEVKKSSTPISCKTKLTEAIEIIMNKDESDIISFISKFKEEFKTLPLGDIAFPRGVNGLEKYHNKTTIFGMKCPIHVRGALIYNHLLVTNNLTKLYQPIKEGEKLKFIYLKVPNTIQSNIISFQNMIPKELALDEYIDYNTQFQKSFLEPLKIILDTIGWKTERVSTLRRFFNGSS